MEARDRGAASRFDVGTSTQSAARADSSARAAACDAKPMIFCIDIWFLFRRIHAFSDFYLVCFTLYL
jgi:hypothetical protein